MERGRDARSVLPRGDTLGASRKSNSRDAYTPTSLAPPTPPPTLRIQWLVSGTQFEVRPPMGKARVAPVQSVPTRRKLAWEGWMEAGLSCFADSAKIELFFLCVLDAFEGSSTTEIYTSSGSGAPPS